MKMLRRIVFALFALAGMVFFFFPLSNGILSGNVAEVLSFLIQGKEFAMAIWLCVSVLLIAAAICIDCFGRGKTSVGIAMGLIFASGVSILIIPWIYEGFVSMPAWGTWGTEICFFLALCAGCTEIYRIQKNKGEEESSGTPEEPLADDCAESVALAEQREAAEAEEDYAEDEMPERFKGTLRVWCGLMSGSSIQMGHMESVVLGRDATVSNLVVENTSVSRKHCIVTYNAVNNTYLLLDISSNGTYFEGGQRIPKSFAMEVQAGTSFYLGTPENKFSVGE
ncbi:MAG TPA: FHA domain-containing protein [Candidatus Choladousia intestinigallinarum]|nr:FHA domain-containing protein [Candidatus Choladousia intestinigallinarum]